MQYHQLTCLASDAGSPTSKAFHDQQGAYMQQVYLHLLYYEVPQLDLLGNGRSDAHIPKE